MSHRAPLGAVLFLFALTIPFLTSAQSTCPALSQGSTGSSVTALQEILYDTYTNFPAPTGYFGPITEAAVQQWQKDHDIVSSGTPATTGYGTVGPRTAKAMGLCTSASSPTSPAQTTPSPLSTRTLSTGASGADVLALQQFLISQNLLLADYATGFFGARTEAAVRAFQAAKGIVSSGDSSTTGYGAVGPKTRAVIALAGTSIVSNIVQVPTPYTPPRTSMPVNPVWPIGSVAQRECTFNGQNIAHGNAVTAYLSSSVASGGSCASQARVCNDGSLSGSYTQSSCTVGAVASSASCSFNGSTVAHNSSVTAYESSVAYGSTCKNQTRTCVNGTLSGSYTAASCQVVGSTDSSTWLTKFPQAKFSRPLTYFEIPSTYNGKAITLYSWFATPDGNGPHPAVILGHGCNGLFGKAPSGQYIGAWPQWVFWADALLDQGYAVLFLESYVGRNLNNGLNTICSSSINGGVLVDSSGNKITISQFSNLRAVDYYVAAGFLSKLPSINPRAIGVFGDSNGGGTTLSAAAEKNTETAGARAALAAAGGKVAAFVALYPGCQIDTITSTFFAPLLILAGSADDWAPPGPCEKLFNYPRASGAPVTLKVYEGATHAYDVKGPTTVRINDLGFHIAYDPAATADSKTRIINFFGQYLVSTSVPSAPASCSFNGSTVAHGASVTAYEASSVAYGSSCKSETRTCSNGTLSGSYTAALCQVAAAPAPVSKVPWPLIFGGSGTYWYHVTSAADIREMASLGMKLQLGTPVGTEYQALEKYKVLVNSGGKLIEELPMFRYLCPEGKDNCESTPARVKQMTDYLRPYLESIKNDPNIVGFWILDDYPGITAPRYLEKIHELVAESNKTSVVKRATICGFGSGALDVDGSISPWYDTTALEQEVSNFTSTGCDIIGLYPYAFGRSDLGPERFDWSMRTLLPRTFERLRAHGWDSTKTPFIGLPGTFGSTVNTPSYVNYGIWYTKPRTQDVAAQVRAYCRAGAIAIISFVWGDVGAGFAHVSVDPAMKRGLVNGLETCRGIWDAKLAEANGSFNLANAFTALKSGLEQLLGNLGF